MLFFTFEYFFKEYLLLYSQTFMLYGKKQFGRSMPNKYSLTELKFCNRNRNVTFYFLIVLLSGLVFWKYARCSIEIIDFFVFSGARRMYCFFIIQIFFLNHPLYSYQQGGSLTPWIWQPLLILKGGVYLLLWVQYRKRSRRVVAVVDFTCQCFSPKLFWSTGLPNRDTEGPVTIDFQIKKNFF